MRDSIVWTGREMIVWGGYRLSPLNDGGRYNPVTDTWIPMAIDADTPAGRSSHTGVWTGSEYIVWGGRDSSTNPDTYFNDGAIYDPITDQWFSFSSTDAPSGRRSHTATWTGTDMIVWGGANAPSGTTVYLDDGGRLWCDPN